MRVITCISNSNNSIYINALKASCNHYGYNLITLNHIGNWTTNRLKDDYITQYINSVPDNEIILFTDGYDTFFCASASELMDKYKKFDAEIVISAEINCYPCKSLEGNFKLGRTKYKYLNSGGFIGRAKSIKSMFKEIESIKNSIIDDRYLFSNQYLFSLLYISESLDLKLDFECEIFQTFSSSIELHMQLLFSKSALEYKRIHDLILNDINIKLNDFAVSDCRLLNLVTETQPCHLHFTGPFFKDVILSDLLNEIMPWKH